MPLREYQSALYQRVREAFRVHERVCMQLDTAAGKTPLFAAMTATSSSRGWNTWIVTPRNELLEQASDELLGAGVKHGRISATSRESTAFDVHVVSKDTLVRRLAAGRVKRPPRVLIIDEAHLALDRYIRIVSALSAMLPPGETMLVLGVTATPSRLDGRGLAELYDVLIEGPPTVQLVEQGWLSDCQYFCPPIEGMESLMAALDKIHRCGTEYNAAELETLLRARKIYGSAIDHYRRHADHKPALVFCRSIKAAAETAQRFSDAGYRFENIDGTMTYSRRQALIDGLKDGTLDGLTSCELITYGLNVPRVECVIMLRPTLSYTMYRQMVGRGLRVWPGKSALVVLDHVGNLQEHGHPFAPHEWNFAGTTKRPRAPASGIVARLCPVIDFLYCDKPSCHGCEHAKDGKDPRPSPPVVAVDLVEAPPPVPLKDRPPVERAVIEEQTATAIAEFHAEETRRRFAKGPVSRLLDVARETGRDPVWVYWALSEGRATVNVPLLYELARVLGYRPGWAWFRKREIEKRLGHASAGRKAG